MCDLARTGSHIRVSEAVPQSTSVRIAREAFVHASRRGKALEPALTKAMRALLGADPEAALTVVNLILARCPSARVTAALGAPRLSDVTDVRGEQRYLVKKRGRRYDLLIKSSQARAVAVEVKLGASLGDRQLDDLLVADPAALDLPPETKVGVVVVGPRQLELGRYLRHERLLDAVRWSSLI